MHTFTNNTLDTVRKFSESEIMRATDNLDSSRKLGQGGFGLVYLGFISGTKVAIKKFTEVKPF